MNSRVFLQFLPVPVAIPPQINPPTKHIFLKKFLQQNEQTSNNNAKDQCQFCIESDHAISKLKI